MRQLQIKLEEIINHALKGCKGEYYYFDEKGIYRRISSIEAKEVLNNIYTRYDGSTFHFFYNNKVNMNIFNKALGRMKVGNNFDEFKEIYENIEFDHHIKPEGMDRFITKIDLPKFIKKPENQDLEVFDFIYIDVFVVTEWESDIYKYILENRKEITNRVVNKLKTNRRFKKFSIPINFLKLTKITYSRGQNFIRFVFELKELNNSHV